MRVLAITLVAVATSLGAQVTRDTVERPFVRGGAFDKPFLTTLAGRTAFGGYAEAQARWQRVDGAMDEASFLMRRLNLFMSSRVSDYVRMGAEVEFEEGGEEIKVEFATIELLISPAFALRGGMILSPLGRFNLAHDSPRNEFTDRPLVSTELLATALSEPGLGGYGYVPLGRSSRLKYEAYLTNGFGEGLITNSEAGTRIPLGRNNFEDNNASPAAVGRIAFSYGVDHEIGLSAHRGAYNQFAVEGVQIDDRRNLTIAVLDAETTVIGTTFTGEGAIATIDVPPGLSGIYADRQRGFYVEGVRPFGLGWVRTMPKSTFAAKFRWDYVDFDTRRRGTSSAQLTAGVNFRPTAETVLKLDFIRGRGRDEFNNPSRFASLLFSLATYF